MDRFNLSDLFPPVLRPKVRMLSNILTPKPGAKNGNNLFETCPVPKAMQNEPPKTATSS